MKDPTDDKLKRRDFLQLVLGWCAALFALGASAGAGARFMVPNVLYEPGRRYKALKPDDYPDGVTFVPEPRVFVVRKGNRFRALSAVCTHVGCTVNRAAEGQGYYCPCHGSYFDERGAVTAGPAPRPMPWLFVSLSPDGRLVVDTSQPVSPDKSLVL